MKRLHQSTLGIFAMCLMMGASTALGSDSSESEATSKSPETITLEEAIGIAKKAFPGKVLEAEYERDDEKEIYEVTIASSDGEAREFEIDAHTGKVLENKEGGEEQEKED